MSVEATVRRIIARDFCESEEAITSTTSLRDDLGADSTALVELMVALEEAFGIDLSEDDLLGDEVTVGSVVGLVGRKVRAEPSRGR
jgi:acyl carrier protein